MRNLSVGAISLIVAGMAVPASGQISPFVEAQVQATVSPCADGMAKVNGLSDEDAKPVAVAALPVCYDALRKLDEIEKLNLPGMNPDERNHFYYEGGNIIWLTAGGEVMRNDGNVNRNICQLAQIAENTWMNVKMDPSEPLIQQMLQSPLRNMIIPACQAGARAAAEQATPAVVEPAETSEEGPN